MPLKDLDARRKYRREYRARRFREEPDFRERELQLTREGKRRAYREKPAQVRAQNRRGKFKQRYGLSEPQYWVLLEDQGFCCASCGDELVFDNKSVHVDHCHTTGAVRGVLCRACNVAFGMLGDDVRRVSRLAAYAHRHS